MGLLGKSERGSSSGGRTSSQPRELCPASGSNEDKKHGEKRKRESVESDRGRPAKRSNEDHNSSRESQQERDLKDEISRKLQRSSYTEGLYNQGREYTERPERTGGKRKREEEDKDNKKIKCDENEAATSSSVITPLGLSHFHFHQELGQGGFGTVILASLKSRNTTVAVKAIPNRKVESILREKRVLKWTAESPYLCHAYGGFQTETHGFLIMEYLPGGNLEKLLSLMGPMDMRTTVLCAAEMICGMQYLHKRGMIHRDLKLENVLINRQGHMCICDFGLAAENVFGKQTTYGYCGTLDYMAPEMLTGYPYGSAVDWWALGVILFHLLSNTSPFCGAETDYEFIQMVVWKEPAYPEDLTKEAKGILKKLLCKEPSRRLGWLEDVREHPFFDGIDWEEIENNTIDPPFLPILEQSNYSVTSQPLSLPFLQASEGHTCPPDAKHIPNFSFVDPKWSF